MLLFGQVGRRLQRLVQIRHVSVVMLAVMDLHRHLVDVRLQRVGRVGQWRKCEWHDRLLFISASFEGIGETEHGRLVEMPRQNLHPYRQSRGGIAARHAHARNARQAAGNRVNVGKVHREGVVHLLAQLERRERRNRRDDRVHLLERRSQNRARSARAPSALSGNTRRNSPRSARTCPT